MDAEDVGSSEDCDYIGGGRGMKTGLARRDVSVKGGEAGVLGESVAEESFAGGSDKDGLVESIEVFQVGQEAVVLVETFAEAEAGVEDDLVARDAGVDGGVEGGFESGEDEGDDFRGSQGRKVRPLVGAASGVHEDGSAGE